MKFKKLFLFLLMLELLSCQHRISLEELNDKLASVDISDGIGENEAKILAQNFLNQDKGMCGLNQHQLDFNNPSILRQYPIRNTYEVQFEWKGLAKIIRLFPILVSINRITGEAQCIGQRVRK